MIKPAHHIRRRLCTPQASSNIPPLACSLRELDGDDDDDGDNDGEKEEKEDEDGDDGAMR